MFHPYEIVIFLIAALAVIATAFLCRLYLHRERERAVLLLRLSADWYWEQDSDYRFSFISRTFPGDPSIFLGRTRAELQLEHSTPSIIEHMDTLRSRQPFKEFEYRVRDADTGGHRWFRVTGEPFFGRNGKFKGYRGVGSDITEQKRRDSRSHMASVAFESAREGMMIVDAAGYILQVNPAFTTITGHSAGDVKGEKPTILKSGRHGNEFYANMWRSVLDRGFWSGEIWNQRANGEVYPQQLTISMAKDETGAISHYIGVFSDLTSQRDIEAKLQRIATHDPLTQLPNRTLLMDRLHQSISHAGRTSQAIAVCFLDLDDFRVINLTHGSSSGNELLIEVASRIKTVIRSGDTVTRIGGDEFALVLCDIGSEEQCNVVLSRLLEVIAHPVMLAGQFITISASVGVTLFPGDDSDPDTLLRHADQAMVIAKQAGKGRFYKFNPATDKASRLHFEALQGVEKALDAGELLLVYQPKINMKSGEIVGAEALIRWQHPERGLLPPMEFMPAIEDTDVAVKVGRWVISEALSQMAKWRAMGILLPVSVNVSGYHLQQPSFPQELKEMLEAHAFEPMASGLEIEILESAAIADLATVSEVIVACLAFGVSFALDDFGTGYSSLTYLKHLPTDRLKIDQSFVRSMLLDTGDAAIVEGVIKLAESFQRIPIAEGVETMDHAVALVHLGCELGQGFGIARPMAARDIPLWLENWEKSSWPLESGSRQRMLIC